MELDVTGKDASVVLVSNTSWYLYNFRRGTILALRQAGYRVVALAPEDDFAARLVGELGIEHMALPMEGKSTRLVGEGRSLLALPGVGTEAGPFTFVMIARLLGDKGVREYVQAAEQVRVQHPDTRFMLIGPHGASNRTAITENEVREWQAAGVIDVLGEQNDVRPFIEQAQVLVLPSYREGMPRTVLEAAAMGRPAIVADVPGCRHAVEAGKTGWLCEVKSADSLAERMKECITMPAEQLQQAGTAARQRIEEEFDERIVIEAALECLRAEDRGPRSKG